MELVLTQARINESLEWPTDVTRLEVDGDDFAEIPMEPLPEVASPEDLAYVIFTSGTTGLPKGVMIEHRAAANTIADINRRCSVGPEDRVLALSSLGFDLSVYDIFGILAAGGAVVLPDPSSSREPGRWLELLARERVTLWNSVPALMKMLLDYVDGRSQSMPSTVRSVLLSGDWIPLDVPDKIRQIVPGCEVLSLGGATEAAIWSISYPIGDLDPAWNSVPYGMPMWNQTFHVLDRNLEPCPEWATGQLFIGGIGAARGYWRDPKKTAWSFIPDPVTGERIYRTGDLGRRMPDGNIEFLGREDSQVKIQGYRIELGEIETALGQHPSVRGAIVTAQGEARGEKRLVAYVQPEPGTVSAELWSPPAEALVEAPGESPQPRDLEETAALQLGGGDGEGTELFAPAEEGAAQGIGVIQDPVKILEFKTQEAGLRETGNLPLVDLASRRDTSEALAAYSERSSHRFFLKQAVSSEAFGEFLACLSRAELQGLPKYRYPSAGGLYPVQTYVCVKPARVSGLQGGMYYYHPRDHRLVALASEVLDPAIFGPENAPIFDRAAFGLFLVADMAAIAPVYGRKSRDFALLEAGYMGQLLMTVASELGLGLCPLGTLLPAPLERLGRLGETHEFLHAFAGGRLDPARQKVGDADDFALFQQLVQQETQGTSADSGRERKALDVAREVVEEDSDDSASPAEMAALVPEVVDDADGQVDDQDLLIESLRDHLRAKLPEYMIPPVFVLLDAFPLTGNGKVDRKALPMPEETGSDEGDEFLLPRNELEEEVAAVWCEVLGSDEVGVRENFFEAGGHSLLAARLIAGLRDRFAVELTLASLFEAPTVEGLAIAIRARRSSQGAPVKALPTLEPDPESRHEPFPLTDLQQAYWLGQSGAFDLGNISPQDYSEIETLDLDVDRLNQAIHRLIQRHDMLRVKMLPDGRQQILPEISDYRADFADLSGVDAESRKRSLLELRQAMLDKGPQTDEPPLLDIAVRKLDESRYRIFFSISLLICDAWSFRLFSSQLRELYIDLDAALPEIEVSFRDYVLYLSDLRETEVFRKSLDYWTQRLKTLPPAPVLPLIRDPGTLPRTRMVRRSGGLEPEEWKRLQDRAASIGVTPDAALGAAYGEVISAWSRNHHFTLNVLYFNRLDIHPQVGELMANFSGTVLLEVDARQTSPFEVRARRLQEQLWRDVEHGHVTGIEVLRELARLEGTGAQAGMPVVFASNAGMDRARNADGDAAEVEGVGDMVYSRLQTPQVWLDHQVWDAGGSLRFNWDVVEELFPEGLIQEMFDSYCGLLHRLAAETEAAWQSPAALMPTWQLELRAAANATEAPLSESRLEGLFAARVGERQDQPAVIAAERSLSYRELESYAESVRQQVLRLGASPETLVAVVMERGWEQAAAVLGILSSGAAYLPLSASLPRERLWHLLERAEVEIVFTQPGFESSLRWPDGLEVVVVDDGLLEGAIEASTVPRSISDLAYVIFTSGSTGQPKGVMIDHRGPVNTVLDVNRRFDIGPEDRVLALSALSFDLSVYDFFGIWAAGGCVVLPPVEADREPGQWVEWLTREAVTVWNTVPALMEMLVDHLEDRGDSLPPTLRLVMMSGDWIPVNLPERIRSLSREIRVVSLGGATEASIWSILHPIEEVDPEWKSIPYGVPMANQRFHVLDEQLEPCPVWVSGDLYIAGVGLARGYWRDERTTSKSFFRHPQTGEALYRTGDLGRLMPNGEIEFLGREDHQVKVQGYRIELGEIEAHLTSHPAVRSAVVLAVGEKRGSKHLAAHVVLDPSKSVPGEELSSFLLERLPAYMVPHTFSFHDSLPLTANGKVDRRALSMIGAGAEARSDSPVAPRDEVELKLATAWSEVLEVENVGIRDNFFDLGGHSLLAVRLMSRIRSALGSDLPLATLLQGPTIEQLATHVRDGDDAELGRSPLVPIQDQGDQPPLFLIHPVGGSVVCYGELARALGSDQPIYGLQTPELAPEDLETRIEGMASVYLAAIREVQPKGPFQLAGWSMGGTVAFEMARTLVAQGESVPLVAMIDVSAPGEGSDERLDDAGLLAWFASDLAGLVGVESMFKAADLRVLEADEALERVFEWALDAGSLPPDLELAGLERYFNVFKANALALSGYTSTEYSGRVVLLPAQEGVAEADVEAWSRQAAGGAEVRPVPGNHYTVIRRPHVEALAAELRSLLRSA